MTSRIWSKIWPRRPRRTGAREARTEVSTTFANWINLVSGLVDEIVTSYGKAEYNRKICLVMVDRVDAVSPCVRALHRRLENDEPRFQNRNFRDALIKLHRVLKDIKEFINDISQLTGYRKFKNIDEVKARFLKIISEFERFCEELEFPSNIIHGDRREEEMRNVEEDLRNMKKFLENVGGGVTTRQGVDTSINMILAEVIELRKMVETKDDERYLLYVRQIPSSELEPPEQERTSDSRGKVYKRMLRSVVPVACKQIVIPDGRSHEIKKQLSILNKLQSSDKIIKFHGMSNQKGHDIIVLEWAEQGDLMNLYMRENLSWPVKLQLAHDICNGLVFLQACYIFHHDIRCENIMVFGERSNYTAKISNFSLSREVTAETSNVRDLYTIVRWLAPEKLKRTREEPYTFKCEVFSFGMLLWELAFQKIPYLEMKELDEIIDYILSEKRETLNFDHYDEHQQIIKVYRDSISKSWNHDPDARPPINELFQKFTNTLRGDHSEPNDETRITDTPVSDQFDEILPLEKGIEAHQHEDHEKAWMCFEKHAVLGDPKAKYWQGYYLWNGYHGSKDAEKATNLFKEAADAGEADAQYHYAMAIKDNIDRQSQFIEYLKKSADSSNQLALFDMAQIHLNGSYNIPKDPEKGRLYLRLAALKHHPEAISLLEKHDS
ncbi:1523_t:CDS:2 [Acaulospora morrowiae]|uniref:1523_t:CDS:1 n=1 Tax=Acaulospora morrowiae TaxID=94023 RepID=A0A9N8YQC4_9GLOM|nr:1523_t:CDS:2 [Acaulospora morrowiae]